MASTRRALALVCAFIAGAVIAAEPASQAPTPPDDTIVKQRFYVPGQRSGYVDVVGTVGKDGSVTEARVVRSEPPGKFDKRALLVVKGWRFRPKLVDGVAIERPFEQRVVFGDGDDPQGAPADFAQAPPLAVDVQDVVPISRVPPQWPRNALVQGISGWVRVTGTIDETGGVKVVRVSASRPRGVFDAATLEAVRHWRFKPYTLNGAPAEREFEQTISYQMDNPGKNDPMFAFITGDPTKAEALYAELRALCPDRYPHADDAPNEALRIANGSPRPRDRLSDVARDASSQLEQMETCLFSTWEQLHDPKVYELAAALVELDVPQDVARQSALALRAYAAALRGDAATAKPSAEQRLQVRSWVFIRLIEAYNELLDAQSRMITQTMTMGPESIALLDKANAALKEHGARDARSVLVKGIKKLERPQDRLLPLMMLARVETSMGDADAARAALDDALKIPDAPWNAVQLSLIARTALCGRVRDAKCFDESLAAVNDELGVADRMTF